MLSIDTGPDTLPGLRRRVSVGISLCAIAAAVMTVVIPSVVLPALSVLVALVVVGWCWFSPRVLIGVTILTSSVGGLLRSLGEFGIGDASISLSGVRWVAIAVLAATILVFRTRSMDFPAHLFPFAAFSGWMAARWIFGGNGGQGMNDVLFYSIPVLLATYSATLVKSEGGDLVEWIERIILWAAIIPVALYAVLLPTDLMAYTSNGPKGIMNPRPVASFFLIVLAVALARVRYPTVKRSRVEGTIFAGLAFVMIVFTASRMATAAAVLLVVISTLKSRGIVTGLLSLGPRLTLVCLLGIALILGVPTLRNRVYHHIPSNIGQVTEAVNVSGRNVMWSATWEHAIQRPVVGWGPGSARPIVASALNWKGSKIPPKEYPPHNEYLQVFHDGGIVGVILLGIGCLGLLAPAFLGWRRADISDSNLEARIHFACVLGLTALLVSAVVDNLFHYTTITAPLFMLLGGAAALRNNGRREPQGRVPFWVWDHNMATISKRRRRTMGCEAR